MRTIARTSFCRASYRTSCRASGGFNGPQCYNIHHIYQAPLPLNLFWHSATRLYTAELFLNQLEAIVPHQKCPYQAHFKITTPLNYIGGLSGLWQKFWPEVLKLDLDPPTAFLITNLVHIKAAELDFNLIVRLYIFYKGQLFFCPEKKS